MVEVNSKKLTVKSKHQLTQASYYLSMSEKRLVTYALGIARRNGEPLTETSYVTIHVSEYADYFGITKQAAIEALKEASNSLYERSVCIKERSEDKTTVITETKFRWVSLVQYRVGEGAVRIRFTPELIELTSELERRFTIYLLEQVKNVTLPHAFRIYEILAQWRSTGFTPKIKIAEFREMMGIEPHEYTRMGDFKKRILDAAIEQLNKVTDVTVRYEQFKAGRVIESIQFFFKFDEPVNDVTPIADNPLGLPKKYDAAPAKWGKLEEDQLKSIEKIDARWTRETVEQKADHNEMSVTLTLSQILRGTLTFGESDTGGKR